MRPLDWQLAEQRLNYLIRTRDGNDLPFVMNFVAPLRSRYLDGERTVWLYRQIMGLHMRFIRLRAMELKAKSPA